MDKKIQETMSSTKEIESVKYSVADQKCCIGTCKKWKTEAISLHPIPNNDALNQIRWFSFIRKSRGINWTPADDNNVPLVCSLHFQNRNYYCAKDKKFLRSNACPSFQEPPRRKKRRVGNLNDNIKTQIRSSANSEGEKASINTTVSSKGDSEIETSNTFVDLEKGKYLEGVPVIEPSGSITVNKSNPTSNCNSPTLNINCKPILAQKNNLPTPLAPLPKLPIPKLPTPFPPLPKLPIQNLRHLPIYTICSTQPIAPPPTNVLQSIDPMNFKNSSFTTTIDLTRSELNPQQVQVVPQTIEPNGPQKFQKSTLSTATTFCLICNKGLEYDPVEGTEQSKSKDILLNRLNIYIEDLGDHPICHECNYKVVDFQNSIDKVMEQQQTMERQRNDLLKEIVKTYCQRLSKSRGIVTGSTKFLNSKGLHELVLKKLTSTFSPPLVRADPPCSSTNLESLRDIVSTFRRQRSDKDRARRREKNKAYYEARERSKLEKQARRQYLAACRRESQARKLRGERVKKKRTTEKAQCPLCKIEILKISLKNHMETHEGEKQHPCHVCGKKFLREANLRTHSMIHGVGNLKFGRPNRFYQCKYCEKVIRHGKTFFRHVASHFGQEILTETETIIFHHCDYDDCVISISDPSQFHAHLLTHSREPISCSSCSKHFASVTNLQLHQKVHSTTNEITVFDCGYCQETFETEEALRTHNYSHEIHVDVSAFNIKCDQCSETFACDLHYQQHRQSKHKEEAVRQGNDKSTLMCEVCGIETNSESRLRMHSYEHTHPEGFPCESCNEIFPNPTKLWLHQKKTCEESNQISSDKAKSSTTKRTAFRNQSAARMTKPKAPRSKPQQKIKLLPCRHCEFVSRGNNYLFRRHLLLSHPELYVNGKPFFCNVCWQNYSTQQELSGHQSAAHPRYICKICNKVFANIIRLQLHDRTHTGEKPYKCQYCDKLFNLEPNLREHEYRHTGERPYKCSNCMAGFLRKKHMMQHIEKFHSTVQEAESSERDVIAQQNPLVDFSDFIEPEGTGDAVTY